MPGQRPRRPDAPDSVRDVQPTTVRFDDTIKRLLAKQAKAQGVSLAQYVEDAAVARLFFELGGARSGEAREVAREISEAARLAQQVSPRRRRPSRPKD